jgi:hypothetical protein
MDNDTRKVLMFEHAKLVAAHASGNIDVLPRIQEIEDTLQMSAPEIAKAVVRDYLRDY